MALEHWIKLQLALGAGCRRMNEAIAYFESAQHLFEAGEYEWKLSGIFTSSQISKLMSVKDEQVLKVIDDCRRLGVKTVTPDSQKYPKMLKSLDDLPAVLYYQGELNFIRHKIAIAVVGTREADDNSLAVAKSLSASLTRSGAIVVSGGALGVDSAAHLGALDAGGRTLAVLGNGFGSNYLMANEDLRARIALNGAVVTEYPPYTPAVSRNFPIRNRIISGLSHGTVVIEAGVKSGSLITANLALEQGRDVFAVPGDVLDSSFSGVNKLISDGATAVFSASDILDGYAVKYPFALDVEKIERELTLAGTVKNINTKERHPEPKTKAVEDQKSFFAQADLSGLSDTSKTIIEVFGSEPVHIDDIIRKTGLTMPKVLSSLTELELSGLISPQAGKFYRKI